MTRGIGDDDRVGVQVDEAKAWTLRLIQHVPLTIHPDVLNVLLQLLDDGRLTSGAKLCRFTALPAGLDYGGISHICASEKTR